jgi:hypothetical protein
MPGLDASRYKSRNTPQRASAGEGANLAHTYPRSFQVLSEQEQIYPSATKELIEQRKNLAPKPADAFKAFSQSVFAEGALPAKAK